VTAAGEYLMTLPQTLEALLAAGEAAGGDAAGGVDAEWLDRARPPRRTAPLTAPQSSIAPLAARVARWRTQRRQDWPAGSAVLFPPRMQAAGGRT
jgi:hypothetical protein